MWRDHPEFASRRRTQVIDGETMTGWFTEDFTLAEIKTLRARERLPALRPANSAFDGQFAVPTFDEIMQLALDANRLRGGVSAIGVYPETKHPAHFAAIGLAAGTAVLEMLGALRLRARREPGVHPVFRPGQFARIARHDALAARAVAGARARRTSCGLRTTPTPSASPNRSPPRRRWQRRTVTVLRCMLDFSRRE